MTCAFITTIDYLLIIYGQHLSIYGKEIDTYTVKFLNFQTLKMLLKPPKIQKDLSIEKLCPKGVDGMASSVAPDQTGSALLAKACVSENFGSLR